MSARGTSRWPAPPSLLRAGLVLTMALVLGLGAMVLVGLDDARAAEGPRKFAPIFRTQTNGAIVITGNSLLSCGKGAECAKVLAGTATANTNNNQWPMAPLDLDSDPSSTESSSSADLALPDGAEVLFAGLFWGSNEPKTPPDFGDVSALKFKVPGGDYELVSGLTQENSGEPDGRYDRMRDGQGQSSYLDVTTAVREAGNGTYWAADIPAQPGKDQFGAWSLVVAYADADAPLRDLTVFSGYQRVTQNDGSAGKVVDIDLSGFVTPPRGPVNARFGMVAYEGDAGFAGDYFKVDGQPLSDARSGADNFFNGSVSTGGETVTNRNPPSVNSLGLDAKVVDGPGALPNGATSTRLTFGTNADVYTAAALTTQIDLYSPDVKGTKSVRNLGSDEGLARPGDTLEYSLEFANTGGDDAIDAVISDELPANVTFVPGSLRVSGVAKSLSDKAGDDRAEYNAAARIVTARVGTGATESSGGRIAAEAKASASFQVTVDAGAAGTILSNVATLDHRAETLNKPLTATSPPAKTEVIQRANLVITKKSLGSHGSAKPLAGEVAEYLLTVRNDGPATAHDVSVRDALPAGFSDVTAQPSEGSCEVAGRTVECDLGELRSGASAQITVGGRLAAGATGSVKNTARISSPDDPTPAEDAVETEIRTLADLAVIKTAEILPRKSGGPISYLLTVRNNGPSTARDVKITDQVPAPLNLEGADSSGSSCDLTTTTVTCLVDELAPGKEVTVRVRATVPPDRPDELANTAKVSSETPEVDPSDNTSTHTLTRSPQANLSVIKRADSQQVVAGGQVGYELVVRNAGPADATGVTLTDRLPEAIRGLAVDDPEGSCRIVDDRTVTCTRDKLAAGSSFTVKIRGDVHRDTPAGPLENTATVTADGDDDPTPSDDTSTSTVEVRAEADLRLTKSGPETVLAGDEIEYVLKVKNHGPSAAQDVVVVDALPAGVRFVGGFSGHGDCELVEDTDPAVVRCPLGRIGAGLTREISLFGEVEPGQSAGPMINQAGVWSPTPDHDQDNNVDAVTTEITRKPGVADLELIKTADVSSVLPGGRVGYRLTATNHGPDPAAEIVITDTVPAGLQVIGGQSEDADCTLQAGKINCTVDELASGASAVIDLVTELDPAYAGASISNTATVSSPEPDPAEANNTSTVEVAVVSPPSSSPEPPSSSPEPPSSSPEPPSSSPEPPSSSPEPPSSSPEPPSPSPEPPSSTPEPPVPPSSQPPSPGPADPSTSDDPAAPSPDPSGSATPDDSRTPDAPAESGPPGESDGPDDQVGPNREADSGDADDPSPDGLPSTGADVGVGLLAAAIGLLLLGATILVVGRYRRRQ
ncbi:hypothetical protein [Microlunatus sp. GCM10028923]|uniref:COG1361 S-layer family protein n=1 Tax=Microlunatus sp. GCM10028923 TaxID=3273400 RepID=UPI00360FF651